MPMTPSQIDKMNVWLRTHAYSKPCPYCGGTQFSTGEIVAAPIYSHGNVSIGGPTMPMAQLVCNNCAHVIFFAAVLIFGTDI